VLAFAIARQRLEAVAGRQPEEREFHGGVDELELHLSPTLQIRRQAARPLTIPERLGLGAGEATPQAHFHRAIRQTEYPRRK